MGEIFNKSYADYSSKQDAKQAFTAFKFKWIKRVALDACSLPPLASAVCALLLQYFNLEEGSVAWMYQDTMATMLRVRRECICKVLGALVDHGHLFEKRQGRDKPNHYWMVLKEDAEAKQDVRENAHHATEETSLDVRDSAHHTDYDVRDQRLRCAQTRTQNPITTPGTPSVSPGESNAAAAAAAPLGDPSLLLGSPQGTERKKKARHGATHFHGGAQHGAGNGADGAAVRAGFDEMRRNNSARPYADNVDEDYRAYHRALQLIDRDTLLANHKAYVKATVEGDGAKYLKSIAAWCDGRGWEKPLPAKTKNGGGRRSSNGARRRRGDGASERDKLHERLAERMRQKGGMQ